MIYTAATSCAAISSPLTRRRCAAAQRHRLSGGARHDAPAGSPRQRTLLVHPAAEAVPAPHRRQLRIDGGERIRDIPCGVGRAGLEPVARGERGRPERSLLHRTCRRATICWSCAPASQRRPLGLPLTLVALGARRDDAPPAGFDPRLSDGRLLASRSNVPSTFDCQPERTVPSGTGSNGAADQLPRQGLSELSPSDPRSASPRLVPEWTATNAADVGHHPRRAASPMSATSSQLSSRTRSPPRPTSIRRDSAVSLRRHALLVDYHLQRRLQRAHLDPGAGQRRWRAAARGPAPASTARVPGLPPRPHGGFARTATGRRERRAGIRADDDATLYRPTTRSTSTAWSDAAAACRPARCRRRSPGICRTSQSGDILLFEEVLGPDTGERARRGPRPSVRRASLDGERRGRQRQSARRSAAERRWQLQSDHRDRQWQAEDALPFPLCLSVVTDAAHGAVLLANVSIALGNIVLADHGRSIEGEDLGIVPEPTLALAQGGGDRCAPVTPAMLPPRFSPVLANAPLTQAAPLAVDVDALTKVWRLHAGLPASAAMTWSAHDARPAIALDESLGTEHIAWEPEPDLLESSAQATDFVVEIEYDGSAHLRFGDDTNGRRPPSGARFTAALPGRQRERPATWAPTPFHVLAADGGCTGVVQSAARAAAASTRRARDQIRRHAPQAFRRQERAVTAADYEAVRACIPACSAPPRRCAGPAAGTPCSSRRSGSAAASPSPSLLYELAAISSATAWRATTCSQRSGLCLSRTRSAGLRQARLFPQRRRRPALLDALERPRPLPDGRRGLFDPDNFSFGQTVYLSPIYAAARQRARRGLGAGHDLPAPGHRRRPVSWRAAR